MSTRSDARLLRVMYVGESGATAVRKKTAGDWAGAPAQEISDEVSSAREGRGTVCFVALPVSDAAAEAKRLARLGCHVFLDTPKPPSVRDLQQVARVAEEAGVSVAMSRPLRFVSEASDWSARSTIAVIEAEFGDAPESWQSGLSETLDLCMYLCKSTTTRNVEVSIEREDGLWPVFAAASLRFDNGSLAILSMRRSSEPVPARCLATVGTEVRQLHLTPTPEAYACETRAFLQAIVRGEPAPTSLSDALAGARLLDQVLALMR